ncbi:hypothetical protein [Oxalicibacterium faecigallinarum]|uniref:ATPase AAA-type core domain-containing protein n=1 Tax=Oxalicibacterium faecigallinarum TaxID=573741 RepID=A0A8J3APG9_9BURK|nr:hypothetical protein [Oxalicibacterium faecigallinarum]GGI16404.1 hypothetical protein GCM10008066_03790 [Oxalicibacterium faecigallinarum]
MPTPAENYADKPVVIYGPAGCGKTTHSRAIAETLGKAGIIEDWKRGDRLHNNAIHLTSDERLAHTVSLYELGTHVLTARVFKFHEAIRLVQTSALAKDTLPAILKYQAH